MSEPSPSVPADLYAQLAAAEDPYPFIHRLREQDPVHQTPLGFWFVTRHDDVKRLFNDPENVTGDGRAWEHYQPHPEGSFLRWASERSLLALPPEDHARVRRLVSTAFTPRAVRRMDAQIREVVERYAAPLRGRRGVVDLLGELTSLVPNAVISRITGVTAEHGDEERFRTLAQAIIRGFLPFTLPDVRREAETALEALYTWVGRVAEERRREPREDLISDLVQAIDRDERLDDAEILMLVTGLVAAGSETTALGALALATALLQHPDAMERLRADRAQIAKSINELIRFSLGGPVGPPRYALRDFTLRGKAIRKGQMLLLSFGGANRDPAVYPDPDTLDLDRELKELPTFGAGPHYCLGANLARQELACLVEAFLDILPAGARLRPDVAQLQDMGMFKRPLNFPVEVPE